MTLRVHSTLLVLLMAALIVLSPRGASSAETDTLVVKQSPHDVATTVARLEAAVQSRGATVVAKVDHGAAAAASGLTLRPTVLVVFGNPKLGTPLMQSRQTAGLDLPLRVLVWQDASGVTQVGYEPPAVIAARRGITDRDDVVAKMNGALGAITTEATSP